MFRRNQIYTVSFVRETKKKGKPVTESDTFTTTRRELLKGATFMPSKQKKDKAWLVAVRKGVHEQPKE